MRPNKYSKADNSGRFNKRVTALRPPRPNEVDEAGQPVNDWQATTTIWAAIEPLRGRELFAAQAVNAEVTTRIRVRWREDVDRKMEIAYKDLKFEILYVIHPEFGRKELHLMCKERQ